MGAVILVASLMPQAIILAGGLGTRLRAVIRDIPKPMAPIHGRPFIEYQLEYLRNQGVRDVVLALGYQWQVIREHLGDSYKGLSLTYSVERRPLGTGGGILLAMRTLEGEAREGVVSCHANKSRPILVLNGDTWFPLSLSALLNFHRTKHSAVTVGVSQQQASQRYATIALSGQGQIDCFSTGIKHKPNDKVFVNGGVYLFSKQLLTKWQNKVGEELSLEHDLFEGAVAENRCYGFLSKAPFLDIGIPEAYYQAQYFLPDKRHPQALCSSEYGVS